VSPVPVVGLAVVARAAGVLVLELEGLEVRLTEVWVSALVCGLVHPASARESRQLAPPTKATKRRGLTRFMPPT
jgi:hypothetical protein